jgi:N6-L-threonylcarbamoyladenine synthase
LTTILGIESSCDETSVAVCVNGEIRSNIIATQAVHQHYGGVVPELASRAHQQNIVPAVQEALSTAKISKNELSAIAFTRGPGLLGSLLVGTSFAKGFALAKNLPLIEVNHMQAHILAHFIDNPKPSFPFLCLTVSGGHTQIVLVKNYFDMEVLGSTIDDAAGEAFSFSGLKTSILYFINKGVQQNPNFIQEHLEDICASVQNRIITILLAKLTKAAKLYGISQVAIAGGVSANSGLRKALQDLAEQQNWEVFIPKFEYCTDNAAMIAIAGYYKFLATDFVGQDVAPLARMPM